MRVVVDNFFTIILIANILLSIVIVFRERKETAQTWAWLLVLMFIPIVGFLLYIFFGRGISQDKIFDLKIQGKIGKNLEIEEDKQALMRGLYPHPPTGQVDVKQLIYMLTVFESTLYTTGNEVTLFTDGREKFDALIEDIKQAKDHIHLQLFVPYINPRINYRNHRKIVVIDGKIGYTGGFNVGNEYLGEVSKFGYWRDNHLRIYGEAVYTLQNRFLMDWNSQHVKEVSYAPKFFPKIDSVGTLALQIVTSGPDSEHEQIKLTYLKMISLAKKEILIQTPYYIPDESIHEALKLALLSGVKVQIQIPNKPDHPLVYWATYSFAAELIEYGAVIETYENGFIHAKTMIIDSGIVSIGSANIDVRSFKLDFEVNALIYDEGMATHVRKAFFADSRKSQLLTKERYENRGFIIKLKEGLARLISPLL